MIPYEGEFVAWLSVSGHEPKTIEQYLYHLQDYFEAHSKLNISNIMGFLASLKSRGYKDNTRNIYSVSIRNYIRCLKLHKKTRLEYQDIPTIKKKKDVISFPRMYLEEYKKILSVVDNPDKFIALRDELLIKFLWATGARNSEIVGLNASSIDLTQKFLVIQTKKGYRERRIFWDDITHEILLSYFNYYEEMAKDDALFINTQGYRLTTRSVQRIFKHYRQKAGIVRRISPHSCRHAFGSDMAAQGVHPAASRDLLGHISISSSDVYYNLNNPELEKIYLEAQQKRN